MLHSSTWTRKIARWFFEAMEVITLSIINATLLVRLGNMQLEGLSTFGGAMLALMVALTSLMFNRARAYPDGPVQRRSLLAAELSLRATLLSAFGAVIIILVFPIIQSLGYPPTPMDKMSMRWVPMLSAFIPMLFFIVGSLLLLKAGRLVTPSLLITLRAQHIRKASQKKPAAIMEAAHLTLDQAVEVRAENGRVIIEPASPSYALDALLAGITPQNLHAEQDFGKPEGKEFF